MDGYIGVEVFGPEQENTTNHSTPDQSEFFVMEVLTVEMITIVIIKQPDSTVNVMLEDIWLTKYYDVCWKLVVHNISEAIYIILDIFAIPGQDVNCLGRSGFSLMN